MAVAKGNSQGPLAIQSGDDGNGRSTRPARGKGYSTPASAVPFPPLRNRLEALVVDDMSTCQMCLRGILESLGVETDIAENGGHAVEIFAGGANYDLFRIDKYLAMTGVEVAPYVVNCMADRQRSLSVGWASVGKMLAVTASTLELDKREFFAASINAYFIKTMTDEILMPFLVQIDDRMP